MLKKLFLFALSFIILHSLFTVPVNAEGEFLVDSNVEYKVDESQKTTVTHQVTLENVLSTVYASAYSIVLDNVKPQNPTAYDSKGTLPLDVKTDGDKTTLKVTFNDSVVGKGKSRTFNISYEEGSFAVRTGEVWEISIPRLDDKSSFRNYTVILKVPLKFGQEAYISPKAATTAEDGNFRVYTFDKESVARTGITAGFGQFQVFSFTLNYHLENPLGRTAKTDIALPPDTAYQKIYYQLLSPEPENVNIDQDGNWLATYKLKPRERLDIKAAGVVQIFAGYRPFPKPTQQALSENLKEREFWEVGNPEIKSLAQKLATPKAIYDYVSTTLSYDYQRVKPNVERLGAVSALKNPKNAICMEFTDLFITLARAAGIPAREIDGYAYTENPQIQPLSLVADVLHAWPEYWDSQKGTWTPVDPTWASTTGGIDYFSKLDLRHFTFVIHGSDSQKPYAPGSYKLGPNPQKDVFVSFGQLPKERQVSPNIKAQPVSSLPLANGNIQVTISNPGPSALYNLTPTVYFDGKPAAKQTIDALPPFSKYEMVISIPFSFLGQKTPQKVEVLVADRSITVPTFKNQVIIYNLILISAISALIMGFVFIRVKKISLTKIISKFRKNENSTNQPPQNPVNKG